MTLGEWWINVRTWMSHLHMHRWSETWWTLSDNQRICRSCGKVQQW